MTYRIRLICGLHKANAEKNKGGGGGVTFIWLFEVSDAVYSLMKSEVYRLYYKVQKNMKRRKRNM